MKQRTARVRQFPRLFRVAFALLLPVLFFTGVWFAVVAPIISHASSNYSEIARKRVLLFKYKSLEKQLRNSDAGAKSVKSTNLEHKVFAAQSPAIASAQLQAKLKTIAASNHVIVKSASSLPVRKGAAGDSQLIGVRVQMTGRLAQLQKIIHAAENSVPFMTIERAQLTPSRSGVGAETETLIDAQIDVFGVFLTKARS